MLMELENRALKAKAEANLPAIWTPLPGPQIAALSSKADILFYGGAAGGGKTDLMLGAACTQHKRSIIFRREYPQLKAIIDRGREIIGTRGTLNKSDLYWHFPDGRQIELGAVQLSGDEEKFQGRPHDLKAFDEIGHFLESQFRFLCGWMRHPDPSQRCRVIAAGNPPTDPEGEWIIQFFGPWLDPQHPHPAAPGELRWFTTLGGKDVELENDKPFVLVDKKPRYNFNPADYAADQIIRPLSRTFIPARVEDNPYYMKSGYMATLQAMPEPLRSKMLFGSFTAGRDDNEWQVVPTEWVRLAQARWEKTQKPDVPITCIGADIARGGNDKTTAAPRWNNWFGHVRSEPGKATPDGNAAAQFILKDRMSPECKVNVDVIGVGAAAYDALKLLIGSYAIPMNASEASQAKDKTGTLSFVNQRAEWIWKIREALDPASGENWCIPPDRELMSDLCAARFKMTVRGIQIELKDEIKKRIGRSPDKGEAFINAATIKHMPGEGFVKFYEEEAARMNKQPERPKSESEPAAAPHAPSGGMIKQ